MAGLFALRVVVPVLGHVLRHVVVRHVLERVPKHVPDRHLLGHVRGLLLGLKKIKENKFCQIFF